MQELDEILSDIKDLRIKNLATGKDFQIKDEKIIVQKIEELNIDGKTSQNVRFLLKKTILFVFFLRILLKISSENRAIHIISQ